MNYLPVKEKAIAEVEKLTGHRLHQLTIAALLIYFGKTTNYPELVFGIPVHKRGSKKLRNIVGMFSGIIAFKGIFKKDASLSGLLKDVAGIQKNDYRHQHYSIGDLSRSLKINATEDSLFDIAINYEPFDFALDFGEQIEAGIFQLSSDYARDPLQISWQDYGPQQPLKLQLDYWPAYFSNEEIISFAERLVYIIEQFSEKIAEDVNSIHLLSIKETDLLKNISGNLANCRSNSTLIDLFEEQVLKTPDAVALVFDSRQLTYSELNRKANKVASFLLAKGLNKETLVPICLERGFDMISGIIGILKAGGAYVPIDPQYPAERIKYILHDTAASILLTSQAVGTLIADVSGVEKIEISSLDDEISKNDRNPLRVVQPNELAYVIYTSGSTGKPKGVLVEHHGVVNLIRAQTEYFDITSDERILQFSSFTFDASVEQMFLALTNGAQLILVPESILSDINAFEKYVIENQVSHIHATPSFLENLPVIHSQALKRVIAGGELCKTELAERWKNLVTFYNEYGPTETTVTAIEYKANADVLIGSLSLPIGRPLNNTTVYILNKDAELVPYGVSGELYIGGEQVVRGYLNLPELTAEKFVEDRFTKDPNARLYKTGDIGRWLPGGNLEYLGRIDDQVKIRGYRIELGEIENVLQESGLVSQAVVIAKPDLKGNDRLLAYVVSKDIFDREELIKHLRKFLPEYMVPSLWVPLANLPLTPTGKTDRKALPEPAAGDLVFHKYIAPRNKLEWQLATIWQRLLHVEQVGIEDNFFDLGGHSLLAMRVSSALRKELSVEVNIRDIFLHPTIARLSVRIKEFDKLLLPPIVRVQTRPGLIPLSFAQERLWFVDKLEGSIQYHIPAVFKLVGSIDDNALEYALRTIVNRHEILRTVYDEVDGQAFQYIKDKDQWHFTQVDVADNNYGNTGSEKK